MFQENNTKQKNLFQTSAVRTGVRVAPPLFAPATQASVRAYMDASRLTLTSTLIIPDITKSSSYYSLMVYNVLNKRECCEWLDGLNVLVPSQKFGIFPVCLVAIGEILCWPKLRRAIFLAACKLSHSKLVLSPSIQFSHKDPILFPHALNTIELLVLSLVGFR